MKGVLCLLASLMTLLTVRGEGLDGNNKKLIIDGIDVSKLNKEDLFAFSEAEDEKFVGDLDLYTGKKAMEEREGENRKRAVPLAPIVARVAWVAGRRLFQSTLPKLKPVLSRSGKWLTKQYFKRGNYRTAVRDFKSLRPTNVRSFRTKNGMPMKTGNIGKTKITVRPWSSSGRSTLELRNPNRNFVRKFRYLNRRSINRWG